MAESRKEAWERVQQLAADVNAQQVKVLQQYADLYQKYLTGDAKAPDPAKAANFLMDESVKYAQKVTELSLNVASELFEHSRAAAERYLTMIGTAADDADDADDAEDSGKAGETTSIIANAND